MQLIEKLDNIFIEIYKIYFYNFIFFKLGESAITVEQKVNIPILRLYDCNITLGPTAMFPHSGAILSVCLRVSPSGRYLTSY